MASYRKDVKGPQPLQPLTRGTRGELQKDDIEGGNLLLPDL